MSICYCNGAFVPIDQAFLPVTDLAIQRGIGVFDSVRTYRRRPFALSLHLARLFDSARSANMAVPFSEEEMRALILEGISRMEGEVQVRPYLTGGDVNQNGTFPRPRLFILFEPLKPYPQKFYDEGISLFPLLDVERHDPLVKSIDYMAPYIARKGREDVLEGLYCPRGEITESTSSSFFLVLDGKVFTAPIGRVLGSITRSIVLDLAHEAGFVVEERCPHLDELPRAAEAFIASTLKEILPVTRIGGDRIAAGTPGPVARHLRLLLLRSIDRWLE